MRGRERVKRGLEYYFISLGITFDSSTSGHQNNKEPEILNSIFINNFKRLQENFFLNRQYFKGTI